jgi:hypothetical protein
MNWLKICDSGSIIIWPRHHFVCWTIWTKKAGFLGWIYILYIYLCWIECEKSKPTSHSFRSININFGSGRLVNQVGGIIIIDCQRKWRHRVVSWIENLKESRQPRWGWFKHIGLMCGTVELKTTPLSWCSPVICISLNAPIATCKTAINQYTVE